jgi:catechol 2,3-dioxygenase-like lactoylglutathione lyase family enzyme
MHFYDALVTFCYTDDLRATAEFYEEKIGLDLVIDQGMCRIYRVGEGGFLGFCERDEAPRPDGIVLTLVTNDVDGRHDALAEMGVEFEKSPAYNPQFEIYHCFLRDPNGYLVEIQSFDDPDWDRPI